MSFFKSLRDVNPSLNPPIDINIQSKDILSAFYLKELGSKSDNYFDWPALTSFSKLGPHNLSDEDFPQASKIT